MRRSSSRYTIGTILGLTGPGSLFQVVAVMPFFIWELVLGLWLTFKGFNESSPLAVAERTRVARTGAIAPAGAA